MRPELYLPFVVGLTKRDPAAVSRLVSATDYKPADLLAFVYRNSIPGYLYVRLSELGQLDEFPDKMVEELERFHKERQLPTCRLLTDELMEVRERLESAGVDTVFIKGPFLAQRFYSDPTARLFWDIDVLVRGQIDVERCDDVLQGMGYLRKSIRLLGYRLAMHFAHDFEYAREWRRLDLHWRLGAHYSFRVDEERMWSSRETILLRDRPFAVLSEEYVLVLLLLALFNDSQRGKLRAKGMIDTYMVLASAYEKVDWQEFFACRAKEGILKISCTLLNLVLHAFDCRSEFPELATWLDRAADQIGPSDPERGFWLLQRSHGSLDNKFWSFRLYDSSLWKVLLWYAASQPIKQAVYR
jgi:hypothetical protein